MPNESAPKRRRTVLMIAAIVVFAVAGAYAFYLRDMRQIHQRMAGDSQLAQTRHGPIEYVSWGSGPPVLVIHGAGGGYDQGRLLPQAFGRDGYRWISVSRFGYLRSPLPTDASTKAQAESFADLMDALKIDRVAILAMSGGVPPALQFAQHFPNRTAALVLLSGAPFTPLTAKQQDLPMPAWLYQTLFGSDFVFWAITKLSSSSLDIVFDISPAARAELTGPDRAFVEGLVDAFLPVTERTAGLRNEGAAVDPNARYDLAQIKAPTLVVHARDDGINPFAFGKYAAENIPGAEFMIVEDGGHILLGHIDEVKEQVTKFLDTHVASPGARAQGWH
jgi:2-hydroxy-6-oxonona-2,4-dienedioate hydrolase